MSTKHTPGPWIAAGDPMGLWVNASEGAVARVYSTKKLDGLPPIEREYPQLAGNTNARANAALIAAAPMLLDACKRATELCECHGPSEPCDICKGLYEAINESERKP